MASITVDTSVIRTGRDSQNTVQNRSVSTKSGRNERLAGSWTHCGSLSSAKAKSTGLIYDDRMLQHRHEWFCGEQESPSRLQRAYERCCEEGLVSRCVTLAARHISDDTLALIHDRQYIRRIKRSRSFTRQELYDLSGQFDGVFFNEFTWNCASLAAGSLKYLTHLVVQGRLTNGLALVRPPGHHAMRSEACGYCVFNNVAIAAASLLNPPPEVLGDSTIEDPTHRTPQRARKRPVGMHGDNVQCHNSEIATATHQSSSRSTSMETKQNEGVSTLARTHAESAATLQRILIVDWDVHHGQGTQYAFYQDNRVLFISIHRHEKGNFWPNLREANYDFVGNGPGKGFNVNIPLDQIDMTDADYLAIFHQLVLPIATEFNPELVIVSCGFDAAIGCPEGRMWLTPAVYGHFIHHLKTLAGGKLVVALEGGYFVDSLAEGAVHVLKALLGDPLTPLRLSRPPCKSIRRTIEQCITALRPYWKSLWIQDVSRIVNRPSLAHLPNFSWPLVRRIVWPETNPLVPEPLFERIRDLMNHGIAVPLPAPKAQPHLLLIPTIDSCSSSSKSGGLKSTMNQRSYDSIKQRTLCPWPKDLLIKLNERFQIQFFRDVHHSGEQYQVTPKRQSNTPSNVNSNCPAKRRRPDETAVDLSESPSPISHSISFADINKQETDWQSVYPSGSNASAVTRNWKSAKAIHGASEFSHALETALTDLFLRRFIRVVVAGHELSSMELVNTITQLPNTLLNTYRARILSNRMGQPLTQPVNFPLHKAMHSAQSMDATVGTEPVQMVPSRTELDLTTPGASVCDDQTNNTLQEETDRSTIPSPSGVIDTCRIMVFDLTGEKDPGACGIPIKHASSGELIRCDILWCSIYTGVFADQLAGCPSILRATQLFRSHLSGRCIRTAQWLRVPLVNSRRMSHASDTPSSTSTSTVTTVNSTYTGSKSPKDAVYSNLLATMFHLILPIAYEYGPDLICVRVGKDWIETNNERVDMALAQLLHLVSGLGAAVLIALTSTRPPSSTVINSLLDHAPESHQTVQAECSVPTLKMQVVLRQMLRANSFRWKSLRFAESLPEWR